MFLKFLSRLVNYRWTDWCISGAGDVLTNCFAENIIYATVNVFVRRFKREARPAQTDPLPARPSGLRFTF
jgi:hypothetical protein